MSFEDFLLSTIETLKNIKLDEIIYGQPGKIVLVVIFACMWVYISSWIYKDASYRYLEGTKTKYLWLVLGILFAPIAWFFYIVFRPSVDLDEIAVQQAEERYLAFESRGLGYCAKCGFEVDPDFMYCPHCGSQVRNRCEKCESLIEKTYLYCPRCGEKVNSSPMIAILGVQEKEKAERLKAEEFKKIGEKRKEGRVSEGVVFGRLIYLLSSYDKNLREILSKLTGSFKKRKKDRIEKKRQKGEDKKGKKGTEKTKVEESKRKAEIETEKKVSAEKVVKAEDTETGETKEKLEVPKS